MTNYQNLITRDHVDLVFGPFSTLLSAPAAQVAHRYGFAFIEPAGGGPAVFQEKLDNVFFAQPAPVLDNADAFVHYSSRCRRRSGRRPRPIRRSTTRSRRRSPTGCGSVRGGGLKTVFKTIYPPETTDLTPIVAAGDSAKPDLMVGGTQ